MKRYIGTVEFACFAAVSLGGTLLHFLYDWLGKAVWIAPFSGVNESTWEHMKLLFWPMLICAAVQSFFGEKPANFWCVKARGIILGITLIPVIFYTYNGAVGGSPDFINIAIFYVSAAVSYIYETRLFKAGKPACTAPKAALAVLALLAVLFIVFTFFPLHIGLFKDPRTGSYGIY